MLFRNNIISELLNYQLYVSWYFLNLLNLNLFVFKIETAEKIESKQRDQRNNKKVINTTKENQKKMFFF